MVGGPAVVQEKEESKELVEESKTSKPLPKPTHLLGASPNTPPTHPSLCLTRAPAPANSDASLANPNGPLANSSVPPVGPLSSPSPP
ncbi:hypothetical protein H2248_005475 [Termitomyces sp. 'cryptogamus']|nr:hypothetical protein H2248_005475 [Termitomyces sp. 'cryptogamus']